MIDALYICSIYVDSADMPWSWWTWLWFVCRIFPVRFNNHFPGGLG